MGIRKWEEMGEEREKDHQGVGAQQPQTPLGFARYQIGIAGDNVK